MFYIHPFLTNVQSLPGSNPYPHIFFSMLFPASNLKYKEELVQKTPNSLSNYCIFKIKKQTHFNQWVTYLTYLGLSILICKVRIKKMASALLLCTWDSASGELLNEIITS